MRIAYIDCQAGASGDMFLGAWLDLGVDEAEWRAMLAGLNVDGYEIVVRHVLKQGIRARKVDVVVKGQVLYYDGHEHHHPGAHHHHHGDHHNDGPHHPHRHLPEIFDILERSDLPEPVREKSKQAFRVLAEAEGQIHGLPPDKVHFHEVGAVDAIVDVVGAMAGWYLAGSPECYVSPIEVGGGTVRCAHGLMPVPAPATAVLLQGFPTYSSGPIGETVTPTGAAIIRTLCSPDKAPVARTTAIGYGAGNKDLPVANVLRIRMGETDEGAQNWHLEPAVVLETNVDDMPPEWGAHAIQRMIDLGAMDAWITPIVMKKGRPALQIHVLCAAELRDRFIRELQRETTSIGVRYYEVTKAVLPRRWIHVETPYGGIRVKLAYDGDEVLNAAPEYEDCKARAQESGVPLKEVYQAALTAYRGQEERKG